MSNAPQTTELLGQNPDPVKLLKDLEDPAMDTDQKKHNHLRDLFLEEADVNEYLQLLDADEEIELTKKQLTKLKGALEGFKVYLKESYLPQTGERIQRYDEKLKEVTAAFGNPEATPEELEGIGKTRRRVAQAMQIAKAPRGAKGKSLREVTQKGAVSGAESKKELSPEEINEYLGEFKARFDSLPQLHKGVQWAGVEKSLRADLESMAKLMELDEKGYEMNVFGEKNDEIQFRSAQTDVTKIASEHRTIMYDKKAQTDYPKYNVNGNAEDIAKSMGVELAGKELYEQLRVQNGWVWLETPADTRKTGLAFDGDRNGVSRGFASNRNADGSFCAALRVKKA